MVPGAQTADAMGLAPGVNSLQGSIPRGVTGPYAALGGTPLSNAALHGNGYPGTGHNPQTHAVQHAGLGANPQPNDYRLHPVEYPAMPNDYRLDPVEYCVDPLDAARLGLNPPDTDINKYVAIYIYIYIGNIYLCGD